VILVDTSVWDDHLRRRSVRLVGLLDTDEVCCHDFVIGELVCRSLRNRAEVLGLVGTLPRLETLEHDEALAFQEKRRLAGAGIGWVDTHLLGATVLAGARLWTLDRRLEDVAARLGVAATG
jgi:predicted nucleic acid-binding protein